MLNEALTRRRFLLGAAATAVFPQVIERNLRAADPDTLPDGSAAKDMITPEAQQAIDRGLTYLARSQGEDGSWGERPLYSGNVAIVGLGGLAFLAGGHHPGRGPYGKTVTRAIRFVLSKEQSNPAGFLFNKGFGSEHGPMYSHGFATMFLAESHGTIADKELRGRVRETLGRAVKVILDSQNNEGGWRYQPEKQFADISVTVCQIMALRAARNAGVEVPKSTVDKCIEYVRACQNLDGGFRYMRQPGTSLFARSAAGIAALYSAGIYQDKAVDRGLHYLVQHHPNGNGFARRDPENFLYGHYYAAQVMWTAGGRWWADWFPAIRDELLIRSRFRGDGAWLDQTAGSDYGTAMACIILQVPNNYLPIMQK
jgi:Prenyltransferase and squalene oxidase repeat